jgi:excisionase family DNA binding protein
MVVTQDRPARLVTLSEAANYIGVGRDLIRRAVDAGQIPTVMVGQRRLISTLVLDRLLLKGSEVGVGNDA